MGAIDRTNYNALVDDSGSNTDGTPWKKTQVKDVILDPVDAVVKKLTRVVWLPNQRDFTGAGEAGRNNHKTLDFDGSADEEATFSGVLPLTYASGGLTCELWCACASATSGTMRFQASIERIDLSSLDIDADSFASAQSAGASAPGTSGQVVKVSIAFTDGAQMDSLAAGEAFRLRIRRDADGTSGTDDITTDVQVLRVILRET